MQAGGIPHENEGDMKHPKLVKILLFILMIALVVGVIYLGMRLAFPDCLKALKNGDPQALKVFLAKGGSWQTLLLLALLQFVQILSIVLPSPPIHIAGGMVAGTLKAFATCHIAYCLANLTVFVLARRFQKRLTRIGLVDEKGSKLVEMFKQGDPWIVVVLACMVPIVPNGLIPYAAAQTNMKKSVFTWSVFVGGFVPTLLLCAIGSNIMQADYPLILLLASIDLICMWEVYENRDKMELVMKKIADLHDARRSVKKDEKAAKKEAKAAAREAKTAGAPANQAADVTPAADSK